MRGLGASTPQFPPDAAFTDISTELIKTYIEPLCGMGRVELGRQLLTELRLAGTASKLNV